MSRRDCHPGSYIQPLAFMLDAYGIEPRGEYLTADELCSRLRAVDADETDIEQAALWHEESCVAEARAHYERMNGGHYGRLD